jgi:4-amino-4-deoxy-L-arabinose transferase-like glycosyltransferase
VETGSAVRTAGWRHRAPPLWLAGIAGLALLVAVPGASEVPLDEHETLVVQTAREMLTRHDWLVPHFNDEPRLNKPPLSYWLTGILATATGNAPAVEPWHGRAVSIAAGIGMLLLTAALGRVLYGGRIGLDAALLLTGTVGFFAFTHDARPDLLYAFWCTAMLLGWRVALRDPPHRRRTAAALGAWVAFALATLTKGPQLPVALALATVLSARLDGMRGACLRCRLRPFTGSALALALTLPWWLALDRVLPAGMLEQSQLGGRLLRPSALHLLDPYYLYRPLFLVAPWLLLAAAGVWRILRRWRPRGAALWLLCAYAVPALILSLGAQQRAHYLLPVLGPLGILLVLGMRRIAAIARHYRSRLLDSIPSLHALGLGGAAAWLALQPGGNRWAVLVAAFACGIGILASRRTSDRADTLAHFRLCAIVAATLAATLAATPLAWSTERYERRALALRAAAIPAGIPLVAWQVTPNVYVYYTDRAIARVRTASELVQRARAAPEGEIAVLAPAAAVPGLRAWGTVEPVAAMAIAPAKSSALIRFRVPGA